MQLRSASVPPAIRVHLAPAGRRHRRRNGTAATSSSAPWFFSLKTILVPSPGAPPPLQFALTPRERCSLRPADRDNSKECPTHSETVARTCSDPALDRPPPPSTLPAPPTTFPRR